MRCVGEAAFECDLRDAKPATIKQTTGTLQPKPAGEPLDRIPGDLLEQTVEMALGQANLAGDQR